MLTKDTSWILLAGLIFLLVTAYVLWADARPEWKLYQTEFRELVTERFGEDAASAIPAGVQQIFVPELSRVDRCTTCHQGLLWKGMENEENPYGKHPAEVLEQHPIEKFACTTCHAGQGYATTSEAAHGFAEGWEEPLLGSRLAQEYQVDKPGALMELRCNTCHRYDYRTEGMEYINRAKEILRSEECTFCHAIDGRGGTIGPDLTYVGDKSPEQYDYSQLSGVKSILNWQIEHFKDPAAVTPETVMPDHEFSKRDAQALALLVLSWKRANIPIEYLPGVRFGESAAPQETEGAEEEEEEDGHRHDFVFEQPSEEAEGGEEAEEEHGHDLLPESS